MTEEEQQIRNALKVNALYIHRLLKTRKRLLERLRKIKEIYATRKNTRS